MGMAIISTGMVNLCLLTSDHFLTHFERILKSFVYTFFCNIKYNKEFHVH